jgi:hypothetical protein
MVTIPPFPSTVTHALASILNSTLEEHLAYTKMKSPRRKKSLLETPTSAEEWVVPKGFWYASERVTMLNETS